MNRFPVPEPVGTMQPVTGSPSIEKGTVPGTTRPVPEPTSDCRLARQARALIGDREIGAAVELSLRELTPDLESEIADVLATVLVAEFRPVFSGTVDPARGTDRNRETS